MTNARVPEAPPELAAYEQPMAALQRLRAYKHWVLAALAILAAGAILWASSGTTITAADQCRRTVASAGYHREEIDWDAPTFVRELASLANYERKKAYERLLRSCSGLTGRPTITCGPLKCGGIFSTETEASLEREARELAARAAQRTETETRRRQEDQPRLERMQRDDQEAMFKRLQRRQ